MRLRSLGLRLNFDSWTGYVAERQGLLQSLRGPSPAIIYGGDSHNAWTGAGLSLCFAHDIGMLFKPR